MLKGRWSFRVATLIPKTKKTLFERSVFAHRLHRLRRHRLAYGYGGSRVSTSAETTLLARAQSRFLGTQADFMFVYPVK